MRPTGKLLHAKKWIVFVPFWNFPGNLSAICPNYFGGPFFQTKGFEIRCFHIVYFPIKRLLQILKIINWVLESFLKTRFSPPPGPVCKKYASRLGLGIFTFYLFQLAWWLWWGVWRIVLHMNEYFCIWAWLQNVSPDIFRNFKFAKYLLIFLLKTEPALGFWMHKYMYVDTDIFTYMCIPYRSFRPLNVPPISLHTRSRVFPPLTALNNWITVLSLFLGPQMRWLGTMVTVNIQLVWTCCTL